MTMKVNDIFDKAYEKFKRYCTEWDDPSTHYNASIEETIMFEDNKEVLKNNKRVSHFTIDELCYSDAAIKYHIDNNPSDEVKRNIQKLIDNILDPLRDAYGKPIKVNSGYRSSRVNKLVGGVSSSQHLTGKAADITVGSKDGNKKLFRLIISLGLPFDQLINESNYSWVHVSFDENRRRGQVLKL